MRHFFTTKVKVILVLALLLAVGLTVVSSLTGKDIPGQIVQSILSPIRAGAKALTNQAEQYYSYMFRYEALAAENEQLKASIAQMEDVARQADSVNRENARLRRELNALRETAK